MHHNGSYRLIAIGASIGNLNAVIKCIGKFKPRKDSVFLVALHGFSEAPPVLADHISRLIEMPVSYAQNEMKIETGQVFLAPPDHHLMVKNKKLLLTKGPKVNFFRPSIDVLFRSVAVEYGNLVIGVLLTGRLSDGILGLSAIKKCGGITIIQDSATADYAHMRMYAQYSVVPDFSLSLEDMSLHFNQLLNVPPPPAKDVPNALEREVENTSHKERLTGGKSLKVKEEPEGTTCPSCGRPHKETGETNNLHVGTCHSFTLQSLSEGQSHLLEETLYVAIRVLDERIALLKKMIYDSERKGLDMLAKSHQHKLEEVEHHASHLRRLLGLND